MSTDFLIGQAIRIKEVRGSPRPPAQWLGKKGRIRGMVADAGTWDVPVGRKKTAPHQGERQYLVEIEGLGGTQTVPVSWLANPFGDKA